MEIRWTEAEARFRDEVREFLEANLPGDWRLARLDNDLEEGDPAVRREWQRRLHSGGWLKLTWPIEDGGRDATPAQEALFHAELVAAGAPPIWGRAGVSLLVPTLRRHGSPDQIERFVEPVLSGDLFCCQAFSEPDAGSDLASLRCGAARVEGGWLLNGQKCWSSGAAHADRAFLLARTDPSATRHQGIGFFLVDLRQPGVEVRPTKQASGHSEFAEIFLTNVFVADEDVVDSPTNGWAVAMTTFTFERAAYVNAVLLETSTDAVLELARRLGRVTNPVVRQVLSKLYADAKVFRWLSMRDLTRYQAGAVPGPETSLSKIGWSEAAKRVRSTSMNLGGAGAVAADDATFDQWRHLWLWSAAQTIYGGTSEIQRNIVAERLLGLPRSVA